jgi:hypothetical protein
MQWPAADVFAEVEARLPAELVGGDERESCRALALRLPAAVTSCYLECRLDARRRVDFLVLFRNKLSTLEGLEARHARAAPHSASGLNLGLARGWAREDTALHDVPFVWLEYDLDERFDAEAPAASPSVGLERGYSLGPSVRRQIDRPAALRRARGAIDAVVSVERRERVAVEVARCTATLPASGALIYLSEMNTRSPSVTKLYVSLSKHDVPEYLRAIRWPGDLARVEAILKQFYAPIAKTVFLDVSIADSVLARIGFAFSQLHASEMDHFDPAWQWLEAPGVDPGKKRALIAWPGDATMKRDGFSRVRRWVDLKIVCNEEGALETKAYLGYAPHLPL